MRISDWSSDVCSSDLRLRVAATVDLEPDVQIGATLGKGGHGSDGDVHLVRRGQATGIDQAQRTVRSELATGMGGRDRKSVGEGKSVSVRVDLGGRRLIQNNTVP